ncbi:ribosome maturation factor RimP [Mycolicibacter arupensis]|uniref:Ribosome maturation factor RimP n=1 Tax=Mycolicibacter arupensis TaxID=342002 RepID=A0A0F5N029_9MYCO|nr:ribosome maturation factor RimP [Mycolicibacter arupensis]KAA1430924.1 ribosome maturation factor RimP [Mycolicibacter arupensis]KKC00371.1 ribosome maturation protein RimP [Mycolicibacter arupensis]MCV7277515.1 ribosome maturation factor RimP [Mycolicibacter arupensis]OQZ91808.1 ribosome maturation factor [Mycolicibacter arupensis]TXI52421.1 MAG: ribosome maturation factor RimP [Mycolicibacter arupensis]
MATGLPSQTQVIELLDAEFTRAGYEIEDVVVDEHEPLPRITVIADGDTPLDLDTAAALSRSASELLDALDFDGQYVLEVSSPGVGRPLTTAKHFRRAHGRKVDLTLSDGSGVTGRVGIVEDDVLTLVVRAGRDWNRRRLPLSDISRAVVQVEFAPPNERELELAGVPARDAGTEAGE